MRNVRHVLRGGFFQKLGSGDVATQAPLTSVCHTEPDRVLFNQISEMTRTKSLSLSAPRALGPEDWISVHVVSVLVTFHGTSRPCLSRIHKSLVTTLVF